MKKYVLILTSSCFVLGCGKASASDETKLNAIEKSAEESAVPEKFVLRGTADFSPELDMRMSLMPAPADKTFLSVMDIDGKHYFALTTKSQYVDGTYDYLNEGTFVRFDVGQALDTYTYEILDLASGRAVGSVSFNHTNHIPHDPRSLVDLCTQAYESVCALSYDAAGGQFRVTMLSEKVED